MRTKTERNKILKDVKRHGMTKVQVLMWNPLVQKTTYVTIWVKQSAIFNY